MCVCVCACVCVCVLGADLKGSFLFVFYLFFKNLLFCFGIQFLGIQFILGYCIGNTIYIVLINSVLIVSGEL